MKKKRIIIVGIALTLIGGGIFVTYENTSKRRYQKNIALAEQFIGKNDFVKAKEYLNVARSIDPNQEEAYKDLFMVYEALGETDQAEAIVEEAIDIFPPASPPTFIDELDVLREEANQLVEDEERLAVVEDYNIYTESNDSDSLWSYVSSYSDVISTSSIQETPSISSNDPKESLASTTNSTDQKTSLLPINERPEIDKEDLLDNEKDDQLASSSSRIEDKTDITSDDIQSNPKTNSSYSEVPSDSYDFPKQEASFLPNTSYSVIAEIGSLDLAPIALNNDCWILKKDNKFKFLFPDGSTKNLEEDHLILQIDPNSLNKAPTLSSACLISKTNNNSNQYYPKEEEVSSCLLENYEKTFYSLEGNYQESKVPVLIRSSKQHGYWIYNPAYEVLFGPFEDSEDTSFYSKMSRLSNITLSGHNGEIGGPYWTTAQSLDQDFKKNNSSTTVGDSSTSTQEAQIWSKDGKSYKTGYTNPMVIDWYTIGAFQGNQFHLLDEDLNVVYAGPFDQGGSVIDSKAPIQIKGVWKLVRFNNIQKNSGPITNYSFSNTDKKEKSENSSHTFTSEQKKTDSSEKNTNKNNSEENKKTNSTSEKIANSTNSSKSYEDNKTKELTDKTDSNTGNKNISNKSNSEETTSDTKNSSLNSSIKNDKADSSASLTQYKDSDPSKIEPSTPIYYSFPEFSGTYTITSSNWRNSFELHSDGTFEGEYTQFFETENLEASPNGEAKVCSYSGTFSLKNNHLKITNLSLEIEAGKTWIDKGILYQSIGLSESCMAKNDTFTLYGPGTPYSQFSPEASRWIPAPNKSITTDFIMVQDSAPQYAYI